MASSMGNASGKSDGDGTCEMKDEEGYEQQYMGLIGHGCDEHVGYTQGSYAEADSMLASPRLNLRLYQNPRLTFSPQVSELMQVHNYAFSHSTTDIMDFFGERPIPVLITWSYGGSEVAVTGSWDNWERREQLQSSGKDLVLIKMLPSGVYHYGFIVDEHLRYAPELPWECDNSGTAYNILDVQEHVPELQDSLAEFQPPSSPLSSYNNEPLTDDDFSKPPPDMPTQLQFISPQLQLTTSHESPATPRHETLNHLYIHKTDDSNRSSSSSDHSPVALASTYRFLQKYVTVVLYKPRRE
ncbi:hypothetical protein K2173_007618 [Erythroxylum novogranatense]|uniref:Association with the SNF1 complex (ASC) domain-containing protein n=1 Tax=Erythroxylum novogranatense TaxID=1862640 RepID=A0AAV8S9A9_9ROSI|nr:hypothetical protein K2173_007618 [Erythroxylum novogranatense]